MPPMPMWIDAAAHLSRIAGEIAVAGLWQGVLLLLAAAVCLRLLPAISAASRFAVWTAVFFLSAVLPILRLHHAHVPAAVGAMPVAGLASLHVGEGWALAIAALWIILSAFRLARLVAGAVQVHGVWRKATPVESVPVGLEGALRERNARLCTSGEVERPSVVGFFSPRVLIPASLLPSLSPAELDQVVLHELEHLRRSDDWLNLLQKLGLALLPLNVALLWIDKRLCLEREMACDDGVLRSTHAPKAYATCLAAIAERGLAERERSRRRESSLALAAWERRSELSVRVHRLLGRGAVLAGWRGRVACSAVVLVLVGGSGELLQVPRLVTFSQAAGQVAAIAPPPLPMTRGALRGYQEVSFQGGDRQPYAMLLKANMPLSQGSASASQTAQPIRRVNAARPHRASRRSTIALRATNPLRSATPMVEVPMSPLKRASAPGPRPANDGGQWIVLTSYAVPDTSDEDFDDARSMPKAFAPTYAAVPTGAGWIVFQL